MRRGLRRAALAAALVVPTTILVPPTVGVAAAQARGKAAVRHSRTAVVVVAQRSSGKRGGRVEFHIPIDDGGRPAEIEADDGGGKTRIKIRQVKRQGGLHTMSVDLHRSVQDGASRQRRNMSVSSTARLARGATAVMGRVPQPGGGWLEVRLTLK